MSSQTQTKGWKTGPFSHKPKAGPTPASQMPNYTDALDIRLGPVHLAYQNGHWRPLPGANVGVDGQQLGNSDGALLTSMGGMDQQEVAELRREIAELREKNRRYEEEVFYLDFKVELLSDMLALKTLEVEKLQNQQ